MLVSSLLDCKFVLTRCSFLTVTLRVSRSNYAITGEDMYDLFGKYGPIRQVRLGNDTSLKTKGTAYVVSCESHNQCCVGSIVSVYERTLLIS
jgi:hypothetical protein